jgi:hypothetical protein
LFFWFTRAFGGHPMPNQVDGFRIAEKAGIRMSALSWVMLLATLVGAVAGCALMLHTMYDMGAATAKVTEVVPMAQGAWRPLQGRLEAPGEPNLPGLLARSLALAITFGLYALRDRGWWCPLHPIGYVMAGSWSMYKIWSSLFLSWVVKWVVLRYGGRLAYLQAVRLGLGMVLGDSIMGTLWAGIGAWLRSPSYNPWP